MSAPAWRRPVGPRSLAERAAAGERARAELVASIDAGLVDRVTVVTPDPHARFVAVDLGAELVRDVVLANGYGACSYVYAWDVERRPVAAPALERFLGGYGDVLLRPDAATLLPLGERAVALVCDAEWPGGEPVDVAPRTVLRERLAAVEAFGLVPSVGIEHEVTFLDELGTPLSGHGVDYALGGTERLGPVVAAVRADAALAGLGVESARAECHPGQYEIVLRHRDALAACDDAMLLQHVVRRAAEGHGARASYLAAAAPGQGSSCHVHLSLAALDGSAAPAGPGGVPDRLAWFAAGVLRAAADLTAVWAPTVNSYVRLRTAPFAPRALSWGVDDRTAAVRLAGRAADPRWEFRFAGADAQPHLVVAALLAAGLAGIADRAPLSPAGTVVGELAPTPWAALDRLGTGRAAELLGKPVAAQLAALLAAELAANLDAVTDHQRRTGALRA